MAHEVFVSYPHDEKPMADAVVHALEERGVRCWVAPRDVPPGSDWAGAIMTAITFSRMVVLVFSDSANESDHILREVRAASDALIPIIPFRTTDADPSPSLQYYLGGKHWLDAITEPMEAHLDELATTVTHMVGSETGTAPPTPATAAPVAPAAPARSWWRRVPLWAKLGGGVAVVAAIVIGVIVSTTDSGDEAPIQAGPSDAIQPDDASEDAIQSDDESGESSIGTTGSEPRPPYELYDSVETMFVLANVLHEGASFWCGKNEGSDLRCEPVGLNAQEAIAGDAAWHEVAGAEDVAAADFDGNGQLDWVFVGPTGPQGGNPHEVCLTVGADSPCTSLFPDPLPSRSVDVADLDGDGNIDILIGGNTSTGREGTPPVEPLHACRGDGIGGFSCEPVGGLLGEGGVDTVSDIAIVDIDADGDLDAVLAVGGGPAGGAEMPGGTNQVCLGDGTGNFECSAVEVADVSSTNAVVSGDFNEDGRVDVAFANFGTPNRLCFGSREGAVFGGFDCIDISSPDNPSRAADVGDVNGDGHLDLLLGRANEIGTDDLDANRTHLCLGDGTGALECEPTPWEAGAAVGVLFHDMNRDGNLDYLELNHEGQPRPVATAIDGSPANVTVCLGTGDGTFECLPLRLTWTDPRGFVVSGYFLGVAVVG